MNAKVIAGLLAAMLLCAACRKQESASLGGHADANLGFAAATLCSGAFECQVAPLFTRVAVIAHETDNALIAHEITVARAREIHTSAVHVLVLLDGAIKACAADPKTGDCTGSVNQAQNLVNQATAELASLK